MEETTAWNDENAIKINEEQLELIKQQSGIDIHELTAAQKQQWKEKLAPLYEQYSDVIGADLLEDLEVLQESYKGE
jgi:C4-dicarboxylate-binding protein DctP